MAVSRLLPSGGANDFNLNITGPTTIAAFDKEYSSGSYSIVSSGNDATLDIYAYNAAGDLVGYSGSKAFTASAGFNKMVILGGTTGDVLGFTYKKTITTTTATSEVTAGPVIYSLTTTTFPTSTSTAGVTGANFATDITGTFTSASTATVYTATVTRNSATSLTIQRPVTLPTAYNPYILTVSNPGVTDPSGSSVNTISVNAGTGTPAWVTTSPLPTYSRSVAYTTTLSATDSDAGSVVSYSIIAGALPSGLSLNETTGVISGTPTVETTGVFTVRATDSGGNSTDQAFTMPNTLPTITNTALAFSGATMPTLTTSNDNTGVTFAVTGGALPSGVSMNSSGVFSGTVSANGTGSVTITATDTGGNTASKALATSFRIQAAGTTFAYNSLPAFFLAGDNISGFPVGGPTPYSTFTGVNNVRITCRGAGGGHPGSAPSNGGGNGGLSVGDFSVTNLNSPIQVYVGGGGGSGSGNFGSGGAGYTGIRRNDNTFLIIAGGGGGGGGSEGQTGGRGGNGGGANQSGAAGQSAAGAGGGGGSTSTGGSGGGGSYGTGNSGGSLYGGYGGTSSGGGAVGGTLGGGQGGYGYGGGGGGGAGLFGGGGGGTAPSSGAGGGGGSGFLNTSYGTVVTATVGGGNAGATSTGQAGAAGSVTITILN